MKKIIFVVFVFATFYFPLPYTRLYADNDVSEVSVYPVPFRPNSTVAKNGTVTDGITFTNLPSEGEIKIFTKKGELIKKITFNSENPTYNWDVKNDNGTDVASGVYIWRIKSGSNSKKGKLMVIK